MSQLKAFTYYYREGGIQKFISEDHALEMVYYGHVIWVTPWNDPDDLDLTPGKIRDREGMVAAVRGRNHVSQWPTVTPQAMHRSDPGPAEAELYADVLDAAVALARRAAVIYQAADAAAAHARRNPGVAA